MICRVEKFKALQIKETTDNQYTKDIIDKSIEELPSNEVLIRVHYSSINYKDMLSAEGNKGVTKEFPHTPGIDAAGVVVESKSDQFKINDKVIVTGYDLGMNTDGGLGEYISVPSDWVIDLPANLSLKESMAYGTAGFTAALSVKKIIDAGIKPSDGPILVTGATGGVGSIAIKIMSHLNYKVTALTGKKDQESQLKDFGAHEVIERMTMQDPQKRPLGQERWASVIDTVGGDILSNALKSTKYGGVVSACGNVASGSLSTSIYPFILRGISLCGIDSVNCDRQTRQLIWNDLSTDWKINLEVQEVSLEEVVGVMDEIKKGVHVGRTIVKLI